MSIPISIMAVEDEDENENDFVFRLKVSDGIFIIYKNFMKESWYKKRIKNQPFDIHLNGGRFAKPKGVLTFTEDYCTKEMNIFFQYLMSGIIPRNEETVNLIIEMSGRLGVASGILDGTKMLKKLQTKRPMKPSDDVHLKYSWIAIPAGVHLETYIGLANDNWELGERFHSHFYMFKRKQNKENKK